MLEHNVDDRFFLSDEMLARFCEKSLDEEAVEDDSQIDGTDDEIDFENFFIV